ncbi:MAG TPA: tetratricopeptide repeat protein, partial [Bryobacteraceae bacterium]|nr:tetratricopeptide repeat protein [Bryobacteraceae bacterium]
MRFLVSLAIAPLLLAQPPLTMFQAHLASGKAAIQQNRYLEADRNLRLAIDNAASRDDGLQLSEALDTLCDLDLLIGKYDDAITLAERSVAAIEKQFGPENPELSPRLKRLAGAYRAGSLTPKAIPVLARALAVDLAQAVAKDPKLPLDYDSLGSAYSEVKEHAEARSAYQKALQLRIESLGPDHAEISNSWFNIALLEERDQKPNAARIAYENALVISEKKFGAESYSLTGILDRLGLLLRREKRYGEAEPVLQRALSIREKSLGARHSDVAPALDNLALAYFYDNKFTEAEPLFTRSLQIWL